ncbi:MAG: radical SAM protein [Candidatus Heimdallarchaeota archaeon]|nr:radical SAM protein [Candidatus Heimdallarchaeota archaeon]
MEIVAKFGYEDLAVLYVGKKNEKYVEFVESTQPPIPREEKWVLIISTMYGCPVGCPMCDAGSYYKGKMTTEEMFEQIDYLVKQRYPKGEIPAKKFKIQFARMGEPVLNPNVLTVIEQLPERYDAPGLMPCISTIAPRKGTAFMEKLLNIKKKQYTNGRFQLQFSIHTTDEKIREKVIPYKKWSLKEIAEYGKRFYEEGKKARKITLNFAAEKENPIEIEKIVELFDPETFLIKLTPINPTEQVKTRKLESLIDPEKERVAQKIVAAFEKEGFQTILSIGELEENKIGSNCGQHALKFENGQYRIEQYMPFQD